MNPFQFKALYFLFFARLFSTLLAVLRISSSMLNESRVFVVVLYKYCVLEDGKCLLPFPPLWSLPLPHLVSLPFPTGMEMGFHIMGNFENIGSNIIFPSTFYSMSKEKKSCQAPSYWGTGQVGGMGGKHS